MHQNPNTMRAQLAAATRARGLQVAASLFAAHGYEEVTMRIIARAMGMSTGALFCHWSGKAALYAEISGHKPVSPEQGRKLLLGLREYFSSEQDPKAALQALADLSVAVEAEVACPVAS